MGIWCQECDAEVGRSEPENRTDDHGTKKHQGLRQEDRHGTGM